MGLDGVLGIEKAFGISISDEEATAIITPRQLTDLVMSKLSTAQSAACLSHIAFHRLRRSLIVELGVERQAVKPDSAWEQFVPLTGRRRRWKRLSHSLQLRLPSLERPRWLLALILVLSVVAASASYFSAGAGFAVFALLGSAFMLLAITVPVQVMFPSHCATVGATAKHLSVLVPAQLKAPAEPWTRAQVREVVHGAIRDVLALSEIPDDARFVEDLGLS